MYRPIIPFLLPEKMSLGSRRPGDAGDLYRHHSSRRHRHPDLRCKIHPSGEASRDRRDAGASLSANRSSQRGLLVPRDAVINSDGKDVVFINDNGQARMFSVEIVGHSSPLAGIIGDDIETGQMVIIKGNERIRDGQSVRTE